MECCPLASNLIQRSIKSVEILTPELYCEGEMFVTHVHSVFSSPRHVVRRASLYLSVVGSGCSVVEGCKALATRKMTSCREFQTIRGDLTEGKQSVNRMWLGSVGLPLYIAAVGPVRSVHAHGRLRHRNTVETMSHTLDLKLPDEMSAVFTFWSSPYKQSSHF